MRADPHAGGPLLRAGPTAASARLAVVAIHGRGGDAEGMMEFVASLGVPDIALFGPEAGGRSWWPTSFLAPAAQIEPWISSALAAVDRAIAAAVEEGFAHERILLVGFSQGACLSLEYVARRAPALAGVFALSGGLVGTADADGGSDAALYGHRPKRFDYAGRLDGVSVRVSCHERDPHIPIARVRESADVLRNLGAAVTLNVIPGEGHAPGDDDVAALRRALSG